MHSPLAISNIVVSQSEEQSSAYSGSPTSSKRFLYPDYQLNVDDAEQCEQQQVPSQVSANNPLPVLVHVKKESILFGTILLGGAICALMLVFSQGVVVASFQTSGGDGADDTAAVRRVEDYNFYVGAVTSLFVKPLLAFVALVVPVALLCFATEVYMRKRRSWKVKVAVVLVANVVLWLLSNGFHAANVHMTSSRVVPVLTGADLFSAPSSSASVDDNSTPVSPSTAGTAVRDTILRSAVQAHQQPQSSVKCDRESPRRLPALVEFGFTTRDWFRDLLPTAPASEGSLRLKVSELPEASSSAFPVALSPARNLFIYGLHLMNDFFRDPSAKSTNSDFELKLPSGFDSAEKSDAAMVTAFYDAMGAKLKTVFNASYFANFRVENAELEFVNYKLSPQVTFEGITFDIPLDDSELRRRVQFTKNDTTQEVVYGDDDGIFEINAKEECSWNGCVISPKGEKMTAAAVDYGSQVRALSICVDSTSGAEDRAATMDGAISKCSAKSDSSMLVFSFAKRITGDEIVSELNSTAGLVTLKNPTKYYTVTVGRLSWQISDIAANYHASCQADSGCDGLSFPLQVESDEKEKRGIVGKQHLPLQQLQKYSSASSWGTMLVSVNVQEIDDGGALKGDFVFPRNFKSIKSWDGIEGQYCEVERGNFLDLVVRNHLYSEDSLQPAYMSALFWLLQSAVVKESRTLSEEEATTTLDFSGNVEWVDAELSIPRFSAILTCSGCALLLLLSVAIQLGGKRREAHIEKFFYAHHLACLVLDDRDLPRHLIKCNLLSVANDRLGSSEHLDEFEISGLALIHCKDPGNVLYVPKRQSTSMSSFMSG
ncbi:hypothetical protein Gpo141_00009583 [Globisporangium polare]